MTMASSISKTLKSSSAAVTKLRTALSSNPNPNPIPCRNRIGQSSASSYALFSRVSSAPLSSESSEHQRSQWSKWMLFLPGAMTFGLGTWQINRREDKIKMLEYRKQRLAEEPVKWNNVSSSSDNQEISSLEFRRILCKGILDVKRSIFVGPRSRSILGVTENGYYLVTPLVPVSNDPESIKEPILVNRVWVPRSWRDKSIDASRNNEGPSKPVSVSSHKKESSWWSKKLKTIEVPSVEVIGVIRGSENPSIFVPPNDPVSYQWFYVDVSAMAPACGLRETTLYVEDINENVNPSSPYPVPKDANTLI